MRNKPQTRTESTIQSTNPFLARNAAQSVHKAPIRPLNCAIDDEIALRLQLQTHLNHPDRIGDQRRHRTSNSASHEMRARLMRHMRRNDVLRLVEPVKIAAPGNDAAQRGGNNSPVQRVCTFSHNDAAKHTQRVSRACAVRFLTHGLQTRAQRVQRMQQGGGGQPAAGARDGVRIARIDRLRRAERVQALVGGASLVSAAGRLLDANLRCCGACAPENGRAFATLD